MAVSFSGIARKVLAFFGWRSDPRLLGPPMPAIFAGLQLSREDALMLSAVWACMAVIATNLAAAPTHIYEPVEGTKRRKRIDRDNRVWLLNTRPNDEMTAIAFREAMFFQALGDGNSYAEIGRDRAGRVAALWPLLSDRVTPRRDDAGELVYDVREPDGSVKTLAARDVIHLRGPSINGLMGENLVARAARTLAVAAAHERFSAAFYGRGAQLGGIMEFPTKLTDEQKASLRESWEYNHAGLGKAHRLLVLEHGAKFNATTVKPVDGQLVEDKKFSVEEIARWWGVPLHKIQHLEHATFSNIEHQGLEFVNGCLHPWSIRYCQELNAKVFNTGTKGPWWYAELDLSHLVRGDAKTRGEAAASWVSNGIKTRNEVRAEEGLDDAGADGDLLTVQSNMTTLSRIAVVEPGTAATPTPAQRALTAAIAAAASRYTRRLANRVEALKSKSELERFALLARFREEQVQLLVEDMGFFEAICIEAIGSPFAHAHAVKVITAIEQGEDASRIVLVSVITPKRLGAAA